MTLLVQKYGGSSVGSAEKIAHVADRVASSAANGARLVVVVSAMQGETDRLLGLASAVSTRPTPREVDQLLSTGEQVSAALLAMALHQRGVSARSLTGVQMKIRTDGAFSRARILGLDRDAVLGPLHDGDVVVATGFQGTDEAGNVTTLGRGGSDTSAVALAAALRADECEIYTDVEGVFTADPRICPQARKIDEISFDEMMELASQGAKVLQIRSVELAMNHDIPIRVRSTFSDDPGTLVSTSGGADDADIERLVVRGISHNTDEIKITLRHVPDHPGIAAKLFTRLAKSRINVDVIVQNTSLQGFTDLSFTVGGTDRDAAEEIVSQTAVTIDANGYEIDDSIAKVSIVGVGMRAHAGVAAKMFETLHQAGINIQMITTSEIKVTVVVQRDKTTTAVNALHEAFDLGISS